MPTQIIAGLLVGLASVLLIAIIIGLVRWNRKKRHRNKDEEINPIGESVAISSELQTTPPSTLKKDCSEMQQRYALATNTQTSLCPRPLPAARILKEEQTAVADPHKLRGTFNLTPSYNDASPCSCSSHRASLNESPFRCSSTPHSHLGQLYSDKQQ
ncbi:hypothetical protein A0J61_05310 [Choanephora cucurbitarum]|uniref:Uncharacterized protein n=1 Tax=Choanephora cucurbitarum TaxID=101091 RepID=A0A1C7NDL0_9FUNG|nr:hypothetical protein A0J61_05310 [Choanephora cucurbitarum]